MGPYSASQRLFVDDMPKVVAEFQDATRVQLEHLAVCEVVGARQRSTHSAYLAAFSTRRCCGNTASTVYLRERILAEHAVRHVRPTVTRRRMLALCSEPIAEFWSPLLESRSTDALRHDATGSDRRKSTLLGNVPHISTLIIYFSMLRTGLLAFRLSR
jgi:hypothetical protein